MKTTFDSILYGFYIIFHPFDGFWDLKYHKKNTFSAANTILLFLCIVFVAKTQLTGFIFNIVKPENTNVLAEIGSLVIPLAVWTVLNWSLTTLLDGKATMKQIWISMIYSLLPLLIIYIPNTILSNFFTQEEGMFYRVFNVIAMLWSFFLIVTSTMTIEDYSFGKTIAVMIYTVLAILAVIFLGMVFFSTSQQLVSFIVTVVQELRFR